MSNHPVSEQLFEAYCRARGYPFEQIPEGTSKIADYFFEPNGIRIVIELAQLDPNDMDQQFVCDMQTEHAAKYETVPGKRLREAVEHAKEKFRLYRDSGLPCMAVAYNNTGLPEYLHPIYDIEAAMYGDQVERYHLTPNTEINFTDFVRLNARLSESTGTYVSAVAILNAATESSRPSLQVFHNWFAAHKLNREVLRHDRQFVSRVHPYKGSGWVEL